MPSSPAEVKNVLHYAASGTLENGKYTEASAHIAKKLFVRKEEFFTALGGPDFYIQLLFVGLAVTLAWLMAVLVQRRVKLHLLAHPPKRIDVEFILKPLTLVPPILALIYLSVVKPFSDQYAADFDLADSAIQICIAYFIAKCVLLVVRSRPMANFLAFVIMLVAALRATGFISYTVVYLNSMGFDIGQFHLSLLNLVHGSVILVLVFWIAGLLSRTLESYLRRSSTLSYTARELTVKFFRVFVYFIALMLTLSALGIDLTAFAVFGGALGVGIGLGLQKITANFVSGITLLMEKSIKIGDLIEVGGSTGWVRQLNIRYALIETSDGREILIPNEELVSTRVTNWTHTSNTARIDIKVGISYDCDPQKVRELMLSAARSHPLCLKDPAPSCWLNEFSYQAMQFLLIFWIPDVRDGRMGPQSEVMVTIMEKFRQAGIEIPCVQQEPKFNKAGH